MKESITSAVRRLYFDAGHRVLGHQGQCASVHGHGYKVFVHAEAPKLDELGMVIDFGILKKLIGDWIDTHWDHAMLLYIKDKELVEIFERNLREHKIYVCSFNPTAENMAEYLLNSVCPRVLNGTNVRITKVVVWETENCYAEAQLTAPRLTVEQIDQFLADPK